MKGPLLPNIKKRTYVKPLEEGEITQILGENHFQSTMALFGWIAFRAPTQLDNRKIDFICRSGHALIEVQVKCRNLNDESEWWWEVFNSDKGLDKNFYDQHHTFLCLVGINVISNQNRNYEKVVKDKYPHIAMIPGKEVVKRFGKRKSGDLKISLIQMLARTDDWIKYFDKDNFYQILQDDLSEQEKENMLIDKSDADKKDEAKAGT